MKSLYNLFIIIILCFCFIFSICLKVEAANVTPVSIIPNPFDPNTEQTTISYSLGDGAILQIKFMIMMV